MKKILLLSFLLGGGLTAYANYDEDPNDKEIQGCFTVAEKYLDESNRNDDELFNKKLRACLFDKGFAVDVDEASEIIDKYEDESDEMDEEINEYEEQ